MSLYGLNRAALNGGVIRAIAGAALVAVIGTATASAGVQTYGAAQAATFATMTADGVRIVAGAATSVTQSDGRAQWVLLITTSANIAVTSNVRATNTEVAIAGKATIIADGTKLQGGAATLSVSTGISAQPKLEVGFSSNIGVTSRMTADAAVKLSGQSGWIIDGYATPIVVRAVVAAAGDRTALGYAQAQTITDCTATGQWVQGGAAYIPISASVTAIGAADSTKITVSSSMTATGSTTTFGQSGIRITAGIEAAPINTTQGLTEPINIAANITVGERLALQGMGAISIASSVTADARLALQGQASIACALSCDAEAVVTRSGLAQIDIAADIVAQWSVLRFGEATIQTQAIVSADPITNPNVHAPMDRTLHVPAELRVMVVDMMDRTMKVL